MLLVGLLDDEGERCGHGRAEGPQGRVVRHVVGVGAGRRTHRRGEAGLGARLQGGVGGSADSESLEGHRRRGR